MGKSKKIEINTNVFAPFDISNSNLKIKEEDKNILNELSTKSLFNDELNNYEVLILDDFLNNDINFNNKNKEIVYEVKEYNECSNIKEPTIYTGKYIGRLEIDKNQIIKINSGYSDSFFKRMINYSNKVYCELDNQNFNNDSDLEFLLLIEYLFLINLKKSLKFDFPKKYSLIKEEGFNIKGNIDIKEYINNAFISYKGYPYKYKAQIYDKDILSTISKAYSLIESSSLLNNFKDISKCMNNIHYKEYLRYFNNKSILKALSSSLLNNECYSNYKLVLKYASLIISRFGFNPLSNDALNKKDSRIKGYLIDITSLYEIYIYNLIKDYFRDYKVTYQKEIKLYGNTFFKRSNYIDILMEKGNDVIIIDTKFKRMDFSNSDVDRSDFHQIHSYVAYFKDLGKKVRYATLLYPSIKDNESNNLSGYLSSNADSIKFGVSYINTNGNMSKNEKEFIERLRKEID